MCGVQFMVILDLAVVNVAVPSIQADLALAQSDLQWVIVTYGVTLGGFLLLGGRTTDLFGRRRVLVGGLVLFVAASLAAGLAGSLAQLVVARALQGLGAAMAAPAALSTVAATFAEGEARTKALGVFAAVSGSAASIGVLASGVLTEGPGWEWIFLINVPIGLALIALIMRFLAPSVVERGSSDLLGAATVTGGLMAVVYAINQSIEEGWTSSEVLAFLAIGAALLAGFLAVERRASAPLVPLAMFRRRTLSAATVVAALVFGSFFATIFQGTLFLQQGLGFSAVGTGAAWLASTASSLVVAGAIAPRFINRFGASRSLVLGQCIQAAGLLSLTSAPSGAAYWGDLFPGLLAFGVGLGFSIMATQVAAFIGVEEADTGLTGGIVETAREIGGAFGTAVVATLVIARTNDVLAGNATPAEALAEGFQRGMLVAAGLSAAAAIATALLLAPAERRASERRTSEGGSSEGPAADGPVRPDHPISPAEPGRDDFSAVGESYHQGTPPTEAPRRL
jgi:EmrB/QacA subfamily drug resistance transporter